MGAGDYPAGVGPAGFDPPPTLVMRSADRAPAALRFDGATREYLLKSGSEDVNFEATHPVDAAVVMSIMYARGSYKPDPRIGNELHKVTGSSSTIGAQVNAAVADAYPLRDLIASKEASIQRVAYSWDNNGRLIVRVDYKNLVTGKELSATNG